MTFHLLLSKGGFLKYPKRAFGSLLERQSIMTQRVGGVNRVVIRYTTPFYTNERYIIWPCREIFWLCLYQMGYLFEFVVFFKLESELGLQTLMMSMGII
jgi:hypothetical protein